MTRVWLLFGVLALTGGQLVYPDQYNRITTNFGRASAPPSDYQVTKSSQSVQQIQSDQFNGGSTAQFGVTNPAASLQSTPETWSNHVNHCYLNAQSWLLISYVFFYSFDLKSSKNINGLKKSTSVLIHH